VEVRLIKVTVFMFNISYFNLQSKLVVILMLVNMSYIYSTIHSGPKILPHLPMAMKPFLQKCYDG